MGAFLEKYGYLVLIVLVGMLFAFPFLSPTQTYSGGDWRLVHLPSLFILKESIQEFSLPLWTQYLAAGTPFFAVPDKPLSYPPMFLLLLLLSPNAALNWGLILHIILAGVFMYFFCRSYDLSKWAATGAAITFMFPLLFIPPYWTLSLAWLPLVFFFAKWAIERSWVYGILSAACLSLMLHAGGTFQFFITVLFVSTYIMFIGYYKKTISIKPILVILILGLFFFGFSAVRLLPFLEWRDLTSRSESLPYEVTIKDKIDFNNAYLQFVNGERGKATLGFIGIPLLFAGLYFAFKKKDKNFQIFAVLLLLALILVTGLAHPILYKYVPGFDAQRGLIRNLFIFSFFASLLVGFALTQIKRKWVAPLLIGLLVIDLIIGSAVFPSFVPYSKASENNELMHYLSEKNKEDLFRIHSYEIRGIDYNDIQMLTIPENIEMLYGHYGGIWVPEYLNEILGVALQSPAKMWGIFNVKYVTSSEELNVSGLNLIEQFNEDENAPVDYMDGPYLYENELALPRAASYEHVVAVVGEPLAVKEASYWLLLQEEFNTNTTLLLMLNNQLIDAIKLKPDAIILTRGSLDRNSAGILFNYPGEVFPDVRNGETDLSQEKLKQYLTTLKTPYKKLDVHTSQNKVQVDLSEDGFVFLSEKFKLFPGWNLKIDGRKAEYYRANAGVVAFPSQGSTAVFTYAPKSFKLGGIITLLSILLAVFLFWRYRK